MARVHHVRGRSDVDTTSSGGDRSRRHAPGGDERGPRHLPGHPVWSSRARVSGCSRQVLRGGCRHRHERQHRCRQGRRAGRALRAPRGRDPAAAATAAGRARSGSAPSRSGCSRPRASSPRRSARTRSSPPPCARPASTSPPCARRSRSSPSRRRPTAPSSATTTTARSTSTRAAARCACRCTPTSDGRASTAGTEVVLNESLNVVLARAPERTGEVVTFKELLDDGHRALIVGRADEERVVELAPIAARREAPGRRLRAAWTPAPALLLEKLPRPEVEELVLEEVPDISYADVGGLDYQIEQITDAVELPYLHARAVRASTSCPHRRASCSTGRPGCGKTLIAKAVANSLGHARSPRSRATTPGPQLLPQHQGPRAAQQVRGRDRAPDPPGLRAGPGEERGGLAGHRLLRRDGLAVPHPRHGHQLRHGVDDRAPAARRDRRRREPSRT